MRLLKDKIQIQPIWNKAPTAKGRREVPGLLIVQHRDHDSNSGQGRGEKGKGLHQRVRRISVFHTHNPSHTCFMMPNLNQTIPHF